MKTCVISKIILLVALVIPTLFVQSQITVMTYNIKLDYPKEGDNSWENRKPFMQQQLLFYAPDFLGIQEAMPNQMQDFAAMLPDYQYIGVGRDDGKNEGEYSAIFYNKAKIKVISSGTFWLSATPGQVSRGWDAACNRVCTWGLFEKKESGQKLWVFNTHLDHVGEEARKNSILLLKQKIEEVVNELPVILMGDFNMEPNNENLQPIFSVLNDSKTLPPIVFGPEATFNSFEFCKNPQRRIDYIFVNQMIQVQKYAVLNESWNQHYPSDHFPVMVELDLIK